MNLLYFFFLLLSLFALRISFVPFYCPASCCLHNKKQQQQQKPHSLCVIIIFGTFSKWLSHFFLLKQFCCLLCVLAHCYVWYNGSSAQLQLLIYDSTVEHSTIIIIIYYLDGTPFLRMIIFVFNRKKNYWCNLPTCSVQKKNAQFIMNFYASKGVFKWLYFYKWPCLSLHLVCPKGWMPKHHLEWNRYRMNMIDSIRTILHSMSDTFSLCLFT